MCGSSILAGGADGPSEGRPLRPARTGRRAIGEVHRRTTDRDASVELQPADARDATEHVALRNVRSLATRRLFAVLDPDQQHVIELAFFRGLSHAEIASRLELPLGTVKARVQRGLAMMRASADSPRPRRPRTGTGHRRDLTRRRATAMRYPDRDPGTAAPELKATAAPNVVRQMSGSETRAVSPPLRYPLGEHRTTPPRAVGRAVTLGEPSAPPLGPRALLSTLGGVVRSRTRRWPAAHPQAGRGANDARTWLSLAEEHLQDGERDATVRHGGHEVRGDVHLPHRGPGARSGSARASGAVSASATSPGRAPAAAAAARAVHSPGVRVRSKAATPSRGRATGA